MRTITQGTRILLADRPYQGSLGASLYVGTPDGPGINYRRYKVVCPGVTWFPATLTKTINPGTGSIPKSQRVSHTTSPTETLSYSLPVALLGVPVACQVRTFQDDFENETIYRPQIIGSDGGGNQTDSIMGTASIISIEKRDGGGMLLTFAYTASPYGVQPSSFALVKDSGPGVVPDAETPATDRVQEIEVDSLADGQAYVFDLQARNGSLSVSLGAIAFNADASGPLDPTNVVAVPY